MSRSITRAVMIGLLSVIVIHLFTKDSFAWTAVHAPDVQRGKNGDIRNAGLFQTNLTLHGEKIAEEPIRGFGRKEQLQDAVHAILGRTWPLRWGGADPRMPVSWKARGSRADTLDHLAKLYGLIVEIDWKKPLVTISQKGYKGSYIRINPHERVKEYRTLSTLSLKENIIRWSVSGVKWHLLWRSRWNARIPLEESFGSDFRQAVIRIIAAANENGGSHFTVDFYPHRVVVIGDRQ